MQLAEMYKREIDIRLDPNSAALITDIKAYVGDQESFEKTIKDCVDLTDKNASKLQEASGYYTKRFIDNVIYKGPGDKVHGLKDNLDRAKFDTGKGQWVVVVDGYENAPDSLPGEHGR